MHEDEKECSDGASDRRVQEIISWNTCYEVVRTMMVSQSVHASGMQNFDMQKSFLARHTELAERPHNYTTAHCAYNRPSEHPTDCQDGE